MASKEEADFVVALRRCVQSAPPMQLQAVVKNLHLLVTKSGAGDSNADKKFKKAAGQKAAWFFGNINRIVFEHETTALFVGAEIPFGERGTAALSADAAVVSATKAAGSANGSLYRAQYVPAPLREGLDDEQDDAAHMFLLLDWARRRVHVVDPLLQTVLRSCTFSEILPLLAQSDSSVIATFNPTLRQILPRLAELTAKENKQFRNLLALHDALQRSWAISCGSRFVDSATISTGSNIIWEEKGNASSNSSNNSGTFAISLTLCAERVNKEAFWSARWRSRWVISPSSSSTDSGTQQQWSATGLVHVDYQSSEGGNVQMQTSEPSSIRRLGCSADIDQWIAGDSHGEVGATLLAPWMQPMAALTTDKSAAAVVELGRSIVRALSKGEDEVQAKLDEACSPLPSEAAVKALRRKMPLSGQLVQFNSAGSSAAAAGMLQSRQQQQQREAERNAQFE